MGFVIAFVAVYRAWTRLAHDRSGEGTGGFAAIAFWLIFGVVLAFGSFTSLFIVMLPVGLGFLLISARVDPARSWTLLVGLVAVPIGWVATGQIDAGARGWAVAVAGAAVVGMVAVAFETRHKRKRAGDPVTAPR